MYQVYVHIEGLDTALAELDQLPTPTDNVLVCRNPRRRDGKDLPYLLPEVSIMILPMTRIVFIEVMTAEEEEEFETFIRE